MILGPLSVADDAERCRCGRVGCLEMIASMPAMIAAARRTNPRITDETELVSAFRSGDKHVRKVVFRAAEVLGEGIGAMIASLNVNHVLIIGPVTQLGPDYLEHVRDQAHASALPMLAKQTHIELGESRGDDVVIGASAMLMN